MNKFLELKPVIQLLSFKKLKEVLLPQLRIGPRVPPHQYLWRGRLNPCAFLLLLHQEHPHFSSTQQAFLPIQFLALRFLSSVACLSSFLSDCLNTGNKLLTRMPLNLKKYLHGVQYGCHYYVQNFSILCSPASCPLLTCI